MLGKGHGGLYKAPTKEERKGERLRGEGDQIKLSEAVIFSSINLHSSEVLTLGKHL